MWDLPGPGLEPMSPALAGGFLTLRHQGSPLTECQSLTFLVFADFITYNLSYKEKKQVWYVVEIY